MGDALVLASDAGVRGIVSGYVVVLPFALGCVMGMVARRFDAVGPAFAIALPVVAVSVFLVAVVNGLSTPAVLWGAAAAVVVYVAAASLTSWRGAWNVWGLVSCVVGVALLFLAGGGPVPSGTDAVLLISGTVLLFAPFAFPWQRAVSTGARSRV